MKSRLHHIWEKFIRGNPAACEAWRNNVVAFITWAQANGYQDDHLLLRYHKEKGYAPENCHWSARRNRGQGRKAMKMLTVNGETKSVVEWSRLTGIHKDTIAGRMASGWPVDEVLSTGKKAAGRKSKHTITLNGETHSVAEWARITGIPYETIRGRICAGKPPEEVLKK